MKTITLTILFAIFALTGCDKKTTVQNNELPQEIRTSVTALFPSHRILHSVKDRDGLELTYDILLDGNIQLEFNSRNHLIEIDSPNRLPDAAIPSKIKSYVSTNYPADYIISWELDDRGQQIKLNNGLELEFNLAGDFVRIDH